MAADRPQSDREFWAQLYPDEASAEVQAEQVRLGLAAPDAGGPAEGSEDERTELDAAPLAAMLARIRQEDFGEDVPAALHASIMDAAREHAAQRALNAAPANAVAAPDATSARTAADRSTQVSARTPRDASEPADTRRSGWARVRLGMGGQFALVAAVLLSVGAVLWLKRAAMEPATKFRAAEHTVTNYVTFDPPPSSGAVQHNEAVALPPARAPMAQAEAEAQAKGAASLQEAFAQKSDDMAPAAEAGGSRAQTSEDDARPVGGMLAMRDEAPPDAEEIARRQRQFAAARERALASRAAKPSRKSAGIDLWGDEQRAPAKPKPAARPAPAAEMAQAADMAPAAPPHKPDELAAIADSFASAHYQEVITRADSLNARTDMSATQKAQALEYKARAQNALGQRGAALDTYERLQAAHPTYKPAEIASQIERLNNAQRNKPSRARGAAPAEPTRPAAQPAALDSAY